MRGDEIVWSIWLVIWTWLWQDWVRLHGGYFLIWNKSFCFFYVQQSCRLTFIQRDVVILESSAAETTTILGTIISMVVDTGTSYQPIISLDLFFLGQFWQKQCVTNLPVFRAAAVSTSEDKIVSKSDAAQNSEEKASKNWSSVGREDVEKKKVNDYFYNDDLILNINIFYVATRPSSLDLAQLLTAGWLYDFTSVLFRKFS